MSGLGQYAYSIIGGSIICAIIRILVPKGSADSIVKLLCGLFFTVSLLYPLSQWNLQTFFSLWTDAASYDSDALTAMGEELSHNRLCQCIQEETEAYILDKATAMGLSVQVQVFLSEADIPVPEAVILSGTVTMEDKSRLEQILLNDLNLSKENLIWRETNSVKKD